MDRHGISFKESARQLFSNQMLTLDINKDSYEMMRRLSNDLDTILLNDVVNGLAYIDRMHRQDVREASAARAARAEEQSEGSPPPRKTPAKGKTAHRREGKSVKNGRDRYVSKPNNVTCPGGLWSS